MCYLRNTTIFNKRYLTNMCRVKLVRNYLIVFNYIKYVFLNKQASVSGNLKMCFFVRQTLICELK